MTTRRDRALDVILAASLGAWGQAEVWNSGAASLAGPGWANASVYGVMSLLLLGRRWAPGPVLIAQCGVLGVLVLAYGSSETLGWFLPLLAGVYAVAAYVSRRRLLLAVAPVLACLALMMLGDRLHGVPSDNLGALPFLGFLLGGWVLGDYARTRRLYVAQLAASAELLAREREGQVRRAAANERTRIAQELHDVLAHGMTVMIRQVEAGQARMDTDPDRARASLTAVAETGRQALGEVRRLVTLLRDNDNARDVDDGSPAPGLGSLAELVSRLGQAGLEVRLTGAAELPDLPTGLALSLYRIVQEALTNAMRHGRAANADVTLSCVDGAIVAEVRDDGTGPNPAAPAGGGLTGMRERAALYGGTVTARAAADSGFLVRATIPLVGDPA